MTISISASPPATASASTSATRSGWFSGSWGISHRLWDISLWLPWLNDLWHLSLLLEFYFTSKAHSWTWINFIKVFHQEILHRIADQGDACCRTESVSDFKLFSDWWSCLKRINYRSLSCSWWNYLTVGFLYALLNKVLLPHLCLLIPQERCSLQNLFNSHQLIHCERVIVHYKAVPITFLALSVAIRAAGVHSLTLLTVVVTIEQKLISVPI